MLAPTESPIRLSELGGVSDRRCRYVVEVATDSLFCGAKTLPGKSYCSHHAGIVFLRQQPRAASLWHG
jgi:hypothetical protein